MTEPARCTTHGEVLRAARIRAGMTQEQLAGLSTVSVRAIRDLEQGRVANPRRATVRAPYGDREQQGLGQCPVDCTSL